MGNNKVYRRLTSVKTDADFLIFNLGNDASQIGKLGADDIFCPSCVSQKSTSCEWATTGLYHVFQNHCYSSSGHVRFVDTFRDQSNRYFGGNFKIYGAWAFGMNSKHMKKKEG